MIGAIPVMEVNQVVRDMLPNLEAWVPLESLVLPDFQRKTNVDRVKWMAAHFDGALLERLLVNVRPPDPRTGAPDPQMRIIDGGHRFRCLGLLGWTQAPVSIHRGWSKAEEQERYSFLNSPRARRGLSAYDMHQAGGEIARSIDRIMAKYGYILVPIFQNFSREDGLVPVTCVSALTRLYMSDRLGGPDGFGTLLLYAKRIWGGTEGGTRSELFGGLHRFLVYAMADRAFNDEHMIRVFRDMHPNDLVRMARDRAKTVPGSARVPKLISDVLRDYYNAGRKPEGRLSYVDVGVQTKSHPMPMTQRKRA